MKLFFAGSDGNERYNERLRKLGAKNRLESYFTLGQRAPSKGFEAHLLDSGGFSARMRGVEVDVHELARYINENDCRLVFNLDPPSVEETLRNQRTLEQETQAYVLPIYHLSDFRSREHRKLIDMYVERYPYIAIGGVAGEGSPVSLQHDLYRYVFSRTRDRVRVHGLGITSIDILKRYPWYSVDSTSWLSLARYGTSKRSRGVVGDMRARQRHYLDNAAYEAAYWMGVEKDITKLWAARGVVWNDFIPPKR